MNLKKTNAVIGLIIISLLVVHTAYQIFAYLTFYYNPLLSRLFGYLLLGAVVLHVVLSITIVATRTDSKKILYKKRNLRTLLQRVSAVAMLLLLPVHVLEFQLLQQNAGTAVYYLIEVTLILFYIAMLTHVAVSFSNALVTLGLLSDIRKKKILDIIVTILCVIVFIAAAVITVTVQAKIFLG